MSIIIVIITIILYLILLGFTWHNLGMVENVVKVMYVLIGTAAMVLITLIIFNISASGVNYQNEDMIKSVRIMLTLVFAPVNGIIVMPYLANSLGKIKTEEITQRALKNRTILLIVIFIVALIVECNYLKDIQVGILEMVNRM